MNTIHIPHIIRVKTFQKGKIKGDNFDKAASIYRWSTFNSDWWLSYLGKSGRNDL